MMKVYFPLFLWLLLCLPLLVGAQERVVTGKVSDASGPMPGVTVQLKGTTKGTATGADGAYRLPVPDNKAVLVFKFIGYEPQEVVVGTQSVVDVRLQEEAQVLQEVVATGYRDVDRKQLTSAVSVVGGKDIADIPMPDVSQLMQGRAPGVYSTAPSGQPGAQQSVRIRGTGSIGASSSPLYVIDGVIVNNGDYTRQTESSDVLSNLNPNDIETLTVLKDAAASALYGARAANGVIVITTKKGKAGQTRFNLKAQYGSTAPNFGNFKMMNTAQAWQYEREAMLAAGRDPAIVDYLRPTSLRSINTDWRDLAFRNGSSQSYELNASGGNERTTYYFSGAYFGQQGTLIESGFQRYSTRLNLQNQASDKLFLSLNTNVSYTDQLNAAPGNQFSSPLLGAFINSPMTRAYNAETGEVLVGNEPEYIIGLPSFTRDNFARSTYLNPTKNQNLRVLGNLYASFEPTKGLKLSERVGIDFIDVKEDAYVDPTTPDGLQLGGYASSSTTRFISLTSTTLLEWNKQFGAHGLGLMAGFELQRNTEKGFSATGVGFATGYLKTLGSAASPFDVSGSNTDYAFLSYISQLNYNFKERYMLSLSLRRDGSSRFGENNRFAQFWSVGTSWVLSDESFLKGAAWVDLLKLRASYGTSGNSEIGNFASIGLYGYSGVSYEGYAGSAPSQVANPDLSWEVSKVWNAGLDFGIFKNRLSGTLEVYRRTNDQLLLPVPVSATSGFGSATRNIGAVTNRGIELTLNTINVQKPITWTTEANISLNRSNVDALYNDDPIPNGLQRLVVGQKRRSWYMPVWAGVNPADGTPLWQDGQGGVTSDYAKAPSQLVGSPEPDVILGLGNTVSYKGLSLSFFFYAVLGNEVYNASRRYIESDGKNMGWNHMADALDRWQKPGDIASRPRAIAGGNRSSDETSTRYLENGSFLRLRNVMLSYQLPTRWLQRARLQGVRIYVQGQNLWTLTKYSGMDPEMGEGGSEFFRYPNGKAMTAGVDLSF